MCIYVYAGTINRPLRLLTVCDNVANTLQNTNVHLRNWLQNIPSGVGTDSSCPYPNIANCTYLHYQIRISPPHYVCVYVYAGAINRPLQLLTAANYVANTLQNTNVHTVKNPQTPTKNPQNILQTLNAHLRNRVRTLRQA